jgi:hypothetical protein
MHAFARRLFVTACLVGIVVSAPRHAVAGEQPDPEARARLDAAWASFRRGLDEARESLVDPAHFPPVPSERNLAEGHRYLLGHLGRLIEQEMRLDPRFPEFHRSVDMLRKHTGENPDAIYLKAPIDATGVYRLRGRAADVGEWRDSKRIQGRPKAPRLVTFQTITGVPGDTGTLAEMQTCVTQTLDFVNSFELDVDAEGRFEIWIAPERPEGVVGSFLSSRKELACRATGKRGVQEARALAVREIFSDWEWEQPLELEIVRIDSEGASRPPIDADWMATRLETISERVRNHIRFWSLLMEFPLEIRRDANGDGRRNLPVNGINDAAPPFTAAGAAGARQLYASGVFELEPDQALVVRVETPVEPHYLGFQLNNPWMEGPDQQNYVSSRTAHQNPKGPDGARTYVIAHRDPGFAGWVDTTGLTRGFHSLRFVYREDPPADGLPRLSARLVAFEELAQVLPKGTRRVDSAARKQEVATRQAHIKQRYRAY